MILDLLTVLGLLSLSAQQLPTRNVRAYGRRPNDDSAIVLQPYLLQTGRLSARNSKETRSKLN
jgi:hypothetical protein